MATAKRSFLPDAAAAPGFTSDRARVVLRREGMAVAEVYEQVPHQPLVVDGHPVTFWHAVEPAGVRPTMADLAHLLGELHSLPDSPCPRPRSTRS